MDFINFNEHIIKECINEYGGSERKKTVILDDNNKYLLKFPDPTREADRSLSYINNALSEYIGCHIFELVGIPVQHTMLGIYHTEDGKEKIACACMDLRESGWKLYEAEKIELGSLERLLGSSFSAVKQIIAKTPGVAYHETCQAFYDRFIIDALTGNTDRHNGNWGFLSDGFYTKLAPVYDCGSSMSPLVGENEMTQRILTNDIHNTASAITDENGRRIHYKEYLLSGEDAEVSNALLRMIPRINIQDICQMIDNIPYITDKRKWFYQSLLNERYDQILLPALKRVLRIVKSDEYKQWNAHVIKALHDTFIVPLCKIPEREIFDYTIYDKQLTVIRHGAHVFFLNDSVCEGYVCTDKTNQNVMSFVQYAREKELPIDYFIESEKQPLKYREADEAVCMDIFSARDEDEYGR